jgi:uncharacterized protein (TIGR02246 family)
MDHEQIRALAKSYAEAWCSQTPANVASHYEENGSLSVNEGAPAIGRAAIADVAQSFMTEFPDMNVYFDDLKFLDEEIRFHWTLTGTSSTQRKVRISGYEAWEFGPKGLIAISKGHFDSDDYQRQMTGSTTSEPPA